MLRSAGSPLIKTSAGRRRDALIDASRWKASYCSRAKATSSTPLSIREVDQNGSNATQLVTTADATRTPHQTGITKRPLAARCGEQFAGREREEQEQERGRLEDVVPAHDADEPVRHMHGVQRQDRGGDELPAQLGRPADGDQKDHGGQRDRHDAQRPAALASSRSSSFARAKLRRQVLGPAIVVVDHPRPDVLLAPDHVVEPVNVAWRVGVGVELIGRQASRYR